MAEWRLARLNSLLKEVISEVIAHHLKNPDLPPFVTVVEVDVSPDLHHAKVQVSVLGSQTDKTKAMAILEQARGFIAMKAAKRVTMRYFPQLRFVLNENMERQEKIDTLLNQIERERSAREPHP